MKKLALLSLFVATTALTGCMVSPIEAEKGEKQVFVVDGPVEAVYERLNSGAEPDSICADLTTVKNVYLPSKKEFVVAWGIVINSEPSVFTLARGRTLESGKVEISYYAPAQRQSVRDRFANFVKGGSCL